MSKFAPPRRRHTAAATAESLPAARALDLRKAGLKQLAALAVLAVLGWLMWDRITALDTARIGAALATVGASQWALGTLFTGVSFWAVGRYDAVVHRLLATPVTGSQAVRSGAAAIAVGQTLGMGALTGALARWRLVPGLSLVDAMRISVIVAISFLAGWAVLAAAAVLVVALPLPAGARAGAGLVLSAAAGLAALSLLRPGWSRRARLPSLSAMTTILGLTALDTLAAGTVLWVLLPAEIVVAPSTLLAAYLLALGAGLVLTTPGGVGPFEVALIALLPGLPQEPVLAAVIAYRALYYALPAAIGGLVLLRGAGAPAPRRARQAGFNPLAQAPNLPFVIDAVIAAAPRAEAGLLRHGRLGLLTDTAGRPAAMAAESGQSLLVLGDPLRQDASPATVLALARSRAETRFLSPVFYKVGARFAAAARAGGWAVAPVADEAWIAPGHFSPSGPLRRQLRRKLRKAETAGIKITEIGPDAQAALPLAEMDEIACGWATRHGGERGFSMGSWSPQTLGWSRTYLAHDDRGRLQGFITVHANAREHTLDLMRARAGAPDGLMQALVVAAIGAAARERIARFSLAAVPTRPSPHDRAPLAWARAHLARAAGADGLRQFKSAFAPHWDRLYVAAPTRQGLALGALDLAREITHAPARRS